MNDEKKFTEESIINKALNKCLCNLKDEREFYLNEDDFKFSFAQALKECGADEIILEYPISVNDLYSVKSEVTKEIKKSERRKIDVRFRYQRKEVFVELKYKQRKTKVTRYNHEFTLHNHAAQNDGLYAIYLDIERMEAIKDIHTGCKSFCIFITNDETYIRPHNEEQYGGISLCRDDNSFVSRSGTIEYNPGNRNYRNLYIDKNYKTNFFVFKKLSPDIKNSIFWIMVIDLQKPVTN